MATLSSLVFHPVDAHAKPGFPRGSMLSWIFIVACGGGAFTAQNACAQQALSVLATATAGTSHSAPITTLGTPASAMAPDRSATANATTAAAPYVEVDVTSTGTGSEATATLTYYLVVTGPAPPQGQSVTLLRTA